MRPARFATLTTAALAIAASTAATADAATFCVGSDQPVGVTCDQTFAFDESGLGQAVTAARTAPANATSDTIRIAPGTIALSAAVDVNGNEPDALVGAGRDATILSSSLTNATALTIGSSANKGGVLSDLTLTSNAYTTNATTLFLRRLAVAERVRVRELSPAMGSGLTTVGLAPTSTLQDAELEVNSSNDDGISLTNGPATVSRVTISGPGSAGIRASFDPALGTASFDHLRVSGFAVGSTVDYGDLKISDSLFDLGTRANARGVQAVNPNTSSGLIRTTLQRVTMIGRGPTQKGAIVAGDGSYNGVPEDGQLSITDSLIDLSGTNATDLTCTQGGVGLATLTLTSVAYRAGATNHTNCTPTETNVLNLTTSPASYRDAAAGDYRPTYDSPVVDASMTITKVGSLTDLAGSPRLVNGRGTGIAAVDLGAYEYQRSAPTQPAISAPATAVLPGQPITLTASGSTDAESEPFTYHWDFGDGTTATGSNTTRTFTSAGTYTIRLIATDVAGATSSEAVLAVTVAAQQQQGGTPALTPTLTVLKAPTSPSRRGSA